VTLSAGDLTTLANAKLWLNVTNNTQDTFLTQLITRCTQLIYSKLNRARLYSQSFLRTFDGVGNYQLILPDYPVTAVAQVNMNAMAVKPYPLPAAGTSTIPPNTFGYGYRIPLWGGNLPGDPSVIEIVNGVFWAGVQNVQIAYTAGYLEVEAQTVPGSPGPYTIAVNQPQGIWSRDNGVVYAATGVALAPVPSAPAIGQYIPPSQLGGGVYTFAAADANAALLISYSFIPADLEEACIQMVAERNSYRGRVGIMDQSLGGQETMRFMRGAGPNPRAMDLGLPPEVESLIAPYVSTIPPLIGAPV
jgi:hypothetical protein